LGSAGGFLFGIAGAHGRFQARPLVKGFRKWRGRNMADVITVPQVRPVQPALRFLRVIPGVLLLAAVGYAGKLLEQNVGAYAKAHHWTFPNIEYVLWAIVRSEEHTSELQSR